MYSVVNALEIIEKIELRAAALYKMWNDMFETDQEVGFLFYKLYLEEKAHASLARYCKKLVVANKKLFSREIESVPSLSIIDDMERLAKQERTARGALNAALEIELSVGENYSKSGLLEIGDSFVVQTIETLSEKGHTESITALLAKRGWKDY